MNMFMRPRAIEGVVSVPIKNKKYQGELIHVARWARGSIFYFKRVSMWTKLNIISESGITSNYYAQHINIHMEDIKSKNE